MDDNQRRARQLTFAAVAALHVAVVWMLLAATRPVLVRSSSANLQLVFIAPTMVAAKSSDRKPLPSQSARPNAASSPAKLDPAPPSEAGPPIPPLIDWADELDRVVKDSAAAEASPKPLDFGFPHASMTPSTKAPEFGWSYAPTHRVESLPGGGLLVNLNDNCVLVFTPLPFFSCLPGKKPVNGDLFKHMRDPSQQEAWGIP